MHSLAERLAERFAELATATPQLRARDAARRLGVSEGALAFSGALGPATPITAQVKRLLPAIGTLGRVMALSRNDAAVHERKGRYEDISVGTAHALVLGPDIDLRIFPSRWRHAVALAGDRPSLQVFDAKGQAVHKVYALDQTDRDAWARLVCDLATPGAAGPPEAAAPAEPQKPEQAVDAQALRGDWQALRDTHDFFPMLLAHKATRRQAFLLAGDDLARRLSPSAGSTALRMAAAGGVPVMVFVGNRGIVQIHSGPVRKLVDLHGWFNVMDPEFNLHLDERQVAEAFRVRKPTDDGVVTSVELLDAAGEVIAQLFGVRKPGTPEDPAWRDITEALPAQQQAAA